MDFHTVARRTGAPHNDRKILVRSDQRNVRKRQYISIRSVNLNRARRSYLEPFTPAEGTIEELDAIFRQQGTQRRSDYGIERDNEGQIFLQ